MLAGWRPCPQHVESVTTLREIYRREGAVSYLGKMI